MTPISNLNQPKERFPLEFLLQSSTIFLNSGFGNPSIIDKVLAILGDYLVVKGLYIYKNIYEDDQPKNFAYAYKWVAHNKQHNYDLAFKDADWSSLINLERALKTGLPFIRNQNPDHKIAEKELVTLFGNHSVMLLPILTQENFWGFIVADFSNDLEHINDADLIALQTFCMNFGSYITQQSVLKDCKEQQAKLKELTLFYENLINHIPAYISVLDKNQKYLYLSDNCVANDETKNWLLGKTDYDYCKHREKPIQLAQDREKLFRKVLKDKQPASIKEKFVTKHGAKYQLRMLTPVYDEQQKLLYVIGFGTDVSELKEKEEIIAKQYLAIDNSSLGIALLDENGNYSFMNKYHAEVFGYTPEELIGQSWKIIYEQDEIDKISSSYFPILMKEGKWSGETLGIRKDKTQILQEISLASFEDGGLVCITRDITHVKEELIRVKNLNNQFELALKAAKLGMWTLDVNSGSIIRNDHFLKMLGYSKEDITDVNLKLMLSLVHPDDRDNVRANIFSHVENFKRNQNDLFRVEVRILSKQGKYIWMLAIGKVFQNNSAGTAPEMTGFIMDITATKEAEMELTKALTKERELNELKSRFVTLASHEFRTPLATIRLAVELCQAVLNKENASEKLSSYPKINNKLDSIILDVDRITDLMSDILTMGKIEAKKVPYNPVTISISKFLDNYINHDAHRILNGRTLIKQLSNKKDKVNIDTKLFVQVLENTISNAKKYSPDNTPIEIKLYDSNDDVVIEVKDYGIGIAEDEMPHLFESFFRSKNVENIAGTGLGMPIMKLFVETNKGEIKVESKLHEGTSVKIYLPVS
jgi:PAS domain S-box-containing protein